MRRSLLVIVLALSALSASPAIGYAQRELHLPQLAGLDELIPVPNDNPLARQSVALGERLFFDPLLSRTQTISCASCHQPAFAFADTSARSRGVRGRAGLRNAPALLNRAYGTSFFWDGRATSLEAQVVQPIQDSLEMDLPLERTVERLAGSASYRRVFADAFPGGVNSTNIARALASYVRTIRSGDSPLDRHRAGDTAALSAAARRGLSLFAGKANCTACHLGPALTDEQFHNTGVAAGTTDVGRFGVTGRESDRRAFKTPSLRDVARTAPYMHDGSLATLEEVVDFYDRGGRPNPGLDPDIRPLALSSVEKLDLLAFLRSLNGTITAGVPDGR